MIQLSFLESRQWTMINENHIDHVDPLPESGSRIVFDDGMLLDVAESLDEIRDRIKGQAWGKRFGAEEVVVRPRHEEPEDPPQPSSSDF